MSKLLKASQVSISAKKRLQDKSLAINLAKTDSLANSLPNSLANSLEEQHSWIAQLNNLAERLGQQLGLEHSPPCPSHTACNQKVIQH